MQYISSGSSRFNFLDLSRNHIANQCVCCGGHKLDSAPAVLMPFVAHRVFGWIPVLIDEEWNLQTIKNGMAYSVCNSLMCTNCGLLFLDIRFSDNELQKLYQNYRGLDYTKLRETYEPGYTTRNESLGQEIDYDGIVEEFLQPLVSFPVDILDWGGDTGKNTPFKDKCNVFDIFDIGNAPVIEGARAINRSEAIKNKYDLVVCSNVLEHIPYPSDLVLDIKSVMHSESILYIEVPFEEVIYLCNFSAINKKKHWHEHINFFTVNSLENLLENCGMRILSVQSDKPITVGFKTSYIIQIACKLD